MSRNIEAATIACQCGNRFQVPSDAAHMMTTPDAVCGKCGKSGGFQAVRERLEPIMSKEDVAAMLAERDKRMEAGDE